MSDPDQLQKTTKFDFFRVGNFGVVRFSPWLHFTFDFLIGPGRSLPDEAVFPRQDHGVYVACNTMPSDVFQVNFSLDFIFAKFKCLVSLTFHTGIRIYNMDTVEDRMAR